MTNDIPQTIDFQAQRRTQTPRTLRTIARNLRQIAQHFEVAAESVADAPDELIVLDGPEWADLFAGLTAIAHEAHAAAMHATAVATRWKSSRRA